MQTRSNNVRNGIKKDLLSILSQKNTKEELDFLKRLTGFMEKRNTPIERPPMLGFKQSELLRLFFAFYRVPHPDGRNLPLT